MQLCCNSYPLTSKQAPYYSNECENLHSGGCISSIHDIILCPNVCDVAHGLGICGVVHGHVAHVARGPDVRRAVLGDGHEVLVGQVDPEEEHEPEDGEADHAHDEADAEVGEAAGPAHAAAVVQVVAVVMVVVVEVAVVVMVKVLLRLKHSRELLQSP